MKASDVINLIGQTRKTDSQKVNTGIRSVFNRLAATLVVVVIAAAPVHISLAGEGFMLMQTEFELSKKPKFRQLNLGYQDTSGISTGFDFNQGGLQSVVIPLYSRAPGVSGLLNRLDDEVEHKEKVTFKQVVMTGLGAAMIGVYMYGIARCVQEAFEYDFNDETVDEDRCR